MYITIFLEGFYLYKIKEVATKIGLTAYSIRYYTDKGLVPSLKRDQNNNRLFDEKSIQWLTGVKKLRACGMSIEDIKKYYELCLLGNATIEERYQIILKQKEIAEKQFIEARQHLQNIKDKATIFQDIIDGKIPDTTNPNQCSPEENSSSFL